MTDMECRFAAAKESTMHIQCDIISEAAEIMRNNADNRSVILEQAKLIKKALKWLGRDEK